ncbi:hypothetical protein AAG570_001609 [Ranatra chinensis]|uniref:Uncharacterized protein n=1 Tax=Ranatra chinensis TaxID=642074 RepID=A0ABD0YRM3_9HEMI
MASKRRNMFHKNKKQETTEIGTFVVQLGKVMSVAEQMESSTLIHLADFSSKELLRLEDERRCQELALMAERERWSREAMEAGRRQLELRQLRQFDDIIKQTLPHTERILEGLKGDLVASPRGSPLNGFSRPEADSIEAGFITSDNIVQNFDEFEKLGSHSHPSNFLVVHQLGTHLSRVHFLRHQFMNKRLGTVECIGNLQDT